MLNLLNTLITLALLVGIVLLQIFLSRRDSRWPGLVLPGLFFLLSLCIVVSVSLLAFISPQGNDPDLGALITSSLLLFLMYNIPTCILLAIYAACREKHRSSKQLEKMNIQDLDG